MTTLNAPSIFSLKKQAARPLAALAIYPGRQIQGILSQTKRSMSSNVKPADSGYKRVRIRLKRYWIYLQVSVVPVFVVGDGD
jgi:hypothetical protein